MPQMLALFFSAVLVRWIYCLAIFFFLGDSGLVGVDSQLYLSLGQKFVAEFDTLRGLDFLGHSTTLMPIGTWLLSLATLVGGEKTELAYVLMQSLMDAGTCVLIYKAAEHIDPRFALPAGIAAVINPTQIVMCGLVYVDIPFTFFIALMFFGILRWWREPGWAAFALIVAGGACATLTRALAAPFVLILPVILFLILWWEGRLSRTLRLQFYALPVAFSLCLAPLLYRNATSYGSWSLTSQGGLHLAFWVVPLVWEARDGTSWTTGHAEMEKRAKDASALTDPNPFERSRIMSALAKEELIKVGPVPIVKAWINGAVINVASPAIVLSPPVSQLPRTGFYGTPGNSPIEKIVNFLFRSDNPTYTWILLTGLIGVAIVRIVQLIGAFRLLTDRRLRSPLIIFLFWIGYILAVNGPIASPKYRLPIEVPLCILTGAGLSTLIRRRAA